MDPRALLEASGFRKVRRRAVLLGELVRLFVAEARENPKDRAYLLKCARDIYRRYRAAGGS